MAKGSPKNKIEPAGDGGGVTLSYRFRVDPQLFRKALYFNNFSMHRGQTVLIAIAWVVAIVLLVVHFVFNTDISNVVMMCYIVVALTIPLMVFSSEQGYRRYRDSVGGELMRTIKICDDWIKFGVEGQGNSEKVPWEKMAYAFELKDMFIFYRDSNLMVILPKEFVPDEDVDAIRSILRDKYGKGFHQRVRV